VLQNKVCRTILSLGARAKESEIYSKVGVKRLDQVHKIRLMMFLFKNKGFFELRNTKLSTRLSKTEMAVYPGWKKEHARMQGRYQGFQIFNRLPQVCRGEKRINAFKKQMTAHIVEHQNI